MKRQSTAEAALAKQVRVLDLDIASMGREMEKLQASIDSYQGIKDQLEAEIASLKSARAKP